MNLHRTENGLEVHHGGIPNDREIGPERELAIALNHVAKESRQMVAFAEILFWRLPAKDRAEILGVSSRTERRIRRDRVVRDAPGGLIEVIAGKAKTASRRLVKIVPTLAEWLARVDADKKGQLSLP